MVPRACRDGVWDVVMCAFHMMHQNARTAVFPLTRQTPRRHADDVRGAQHFFPPGAPRGDDAPARRRRRSAAKRSPTVTTRWGFWFTQAGMTEAPAASSTPPIALSRHEPGADVVLFGTGDHEHLRSNIASILKPPLPEADRARLASLFGHLRRGRARRAPSLALRPRHKS